jgi:hypothetical protein
VRVNARLGLRLRVILSYLAFSCFVLSCLKYGVRVKARLRLRLRVMLSYLVLSCLVSNMG